MKRLRISVIFWMAFLAIKPLVFAEDLKEGKTEISASTTSLVEWPEYKDWPVHHQESFKVWLTNSDFEEYRYLVKIGTATVYAGNFAEQELEAAEYSIFGKKALWRRLSQKSGQLLTEQIFLKNEWVPVRPGVFFAYALEPEKFLAEHKVTGILLSFTPLDPRSPPLELRIKNDNP